MWSADMMMVTRASLLSSAPLKLKIVVTSCVRGLRTAAIYDPNYYTLKM